MISECGIKLINRRFKNFNLRLDCVAQSPISTDLSNDFSNRRLNVLSFHLPRVGQIKCTHLKRTKASYSLELRVNGAFLFYLCETPKNSRGKKLIIVPLQLNSISYISERSIFFFFFFAITEFIVYNNNTFQKNNRLRFTVMISQQNSRCIVRLGTLNL